MVPAGGAGAGAAAQDWPAGLVSGALAELPGVVGTLEREADIAAWGGLQVAGFAGKAAPSWTDSGVGALGDSPCRASEARRGRDTQDTRYIGPRGTRVPFLRARLRASHS